MRGLYTALASLKHKLDNIMPTLSNSEEAVAAARRYLAERLGDRAPAAAAERGFRKGRRDSNTSVASTLSQLGELSEEFLVAIFSSAVTHSTG